MTLFLGIDGGGSGCRAALLDDAGRFLGRGEGGPANIWSDLEGALASILVASEAAVADAGRVWEPAEIVAGLGLAGANAPAAAAALAARLPFGRAAIESDAIVALRGALGDEDGITANLGTGSVYGVKRQGRVRMIGGWGFVLGDQGSGAWIGRKVRETALLAHDGIEAMTPFLAALLAEAGGATGLLEFASRAGPVAYAATVPQVIEAEAAGDPAAAAVMKQAEEEIARAIDRLQSEDGPLPVAFLGGLGAVFAPRLARHYAGLVRAPAGTTLDGALALARGLG